MFFFVTTLERSNQKILAWLAELSRSNDVVLAILDDTSQALDHLQQLVGAIDKSSSSAGVCSAGDIKDDNDGDPTPFPAASLVGKLNNRQRNILDLISAGLSNKEIALKLELPTDTIRGELKKIFRMLGVRNRTRAAVISRKLHSHNGREFEE